MVRIPTDISLSHTVHCITLILVDIGFSCFDFKNPIGRDTRIESTDQMESQIFSFEKVKIPDKKMVRRFKKKSYPEKKISYPEKKKLTRETKTKLSNDVCIKYSCPACQKNYGMLQNLQAHFRRDHSYLNLELDPSKVKNCLN